MKPILLTAFLFAPALYAAEPLTFESTEAKATLIELFSSEGCSSCPPAEAWMSRLRSSADLWKSIVPVVFHVDYWDGLGWRDRFASPAFSERQRRYARIWGSDSVYTPGFVLNGGEWRGWFDRAPVPAPPMTKGGILRVVLHNRTRADVTFSPATATAAAFVAELALLGGNLESDVKRGENSGRKLRHDFIALHLASTALRIDGSRFTGKIELPVETKENPIAMVAWITAADSTQPFQATGGWLPQK